jgi:hypothetical protein
MNKKEVLRELEEIRNQVYWTNYKSVEKIDKLIYTIKKQAKTSEKVGE